MLSLQHERKGASPRQQGNGGARQLQLLAGQGRAAWRRTQGPRLSPASRTAAEAGCGTWEAGVRGQLRPVSWRRRAGNGNERPLRISAAVGEELVQWRRRRVQGQECRRIRPREHAPWL